MRKSVLDQIQADFDRGVERVQRYLTSEQGVRLRHQVSAAMMAAAPVVALAVRKRLPLLGRFAGTATLAAAVVTIAGKIRDWDPSHELQPKP